MKIENIMKVIDVPDHSISNETLTAMLLYLEPPYRDQVLTEHLYGVEHFQELTEERDKMLPEAVKKELLEMYEQANANDAAYIRITFS